MLDGQQHQNRFSHQAKTLAPGSGGHELSPLQERDLDGRMGKEEKRKVNLLLSTPFLSEIKTG